jgi:hypothetical protein
MKTVIFNVFSILCRTSVESTGYRAQHLGWVNKVREHALCVFQGQYTYFFVAGVRSKTSMSKNCSVLWNKVTTNLSYCELHWTVKLVIMVVKFRNKPCSTVKKKFCCRSISTIFLFLLRYSYIIKLNVNTLTSLN